MKRALADHQARELKAPDESNDDGTRTFSVADYASADKLAAALRTIDGVESAYAKPAEEAP